MAADGGLSRGKLGGGGAGGFGLRDFVRDLLPTPEASDGTGGRVSAEMGGQRPSGSKRAVTIATAVSHLLKTPTAQLAVNGGSQHPDKRRAGGHGPTLADQVECELLPTPAARDWKSGQSNLIGTNARPLNEIVEMLLPTPTARTQDRTPEEAARRHLPGRAMGRNGGASPDLASVAALLPSATGESTRPPFGAGNASSDAPRHAQLSLDGLESD
jgi:hypothetical protein